MAESIRFLDMLATRRKTFEKEAYSSVDALVFSNMAGMPLRGIVQEFQHGKGMRKLITVNSACKAILAKNKKENFLKDDDKTFLQIMMRNPRYKNVELCAYLNTYDKEKVTGISAVTAVMPKSDDMVIAYAGTGAEIERWIENLRLLYAEEVNAQKDAVAYMEGVADMYPGKWIHAAGYSKGDRFATEAAIKLKEGNMKRLASLYCIDGPGFNEHIEQNPLWRKKYGQVREQLEDRMRTVSPEKMIVGGLLWDMPGKERNFFSSDGEHFLCHDLYNFRFKDGDFAIVEGNKPHPAYARFCEALQKTLMKFSISRRGVLVDSLERIIRTHNVGTFAEMATVLQKPRIFETIDNLTIGEKSALTTFAATLVTNIKREKFDYRGKNPALKVLSTAKKEIFGNRTFNIVPNIIRLLGAVMIVVDGVLDTLKGIGKKISGIFKKKPKAEAVLPATESHQLNERTEEEKPHSVRIQKRIARQAEKDRSIIARRAAGTGRGLR